MSKKGHSFNCLMDDETYSLMTRTANHLEMSCGALIRRLVKSAALMSLSQQPTCVSGQRCFAPHMHPPPDTQAATAVHPPVDQPFPKGAI